VESFAAAATDVTSPGIAAWRGISGAATVLLQAASQLANVAVSAAVHDQVRLSGWLWFNDTFNTNEVISLRYK